MHWLHQAIHQAAGLGELNIFKRFFLRVRSSQAERDQVLVDLQFVLKKRDFQFFSPQVSAQRFERLAGSPVAVVREAARRFPPTPVDLQPGARHH